MQKHDRGCNASQTVKRAEPKLRSR